MEGGREAPGAAARVMLLVATFTTQPGEDAEAEEVPKNTISPTTAAEARPPPSTTSVEPAGAGEDQDSALPPTNTCAQGPRVKGNGRPGAVKNHYTIQAE